MKGLIKYLKSLFNNDIEEYVCISINGELNYLKPGETYNINGYEITVGESCNKDTMITLDI